MNVTFNSDTVAFLVHEIDDILSNADITAGMCDDLSNLLNALMQIGETGSIVIIPDDDNIGDDWDDEDDGPDSPAPSGWTLIEA
jgi:hypothetical protein